MVPERPSVARRNFISRGAARLAASLWRKGPAAGLDRALEMEQRRTHMLHYVWMFVIGILVGLLARAILPGTQHMGLLMTGVLGIVGSYVGGLLTRIVHKPADGSVLHPAGIVMSVIGAIIVLYLWYRFGA